MVRKEEKEMISKLAVKEYLNKELDSWLFVKNIPEEVLYEEINKLAPGFKFKTKPRQCQLACIYIALYNDYFNFWLKQGLGKSKEALDVIQLKRIMNNDLDRTLLVCPSEVSYGNWEDEIEEHSNLSSIGLFGSKDERSKILRKKRDIYGINYEGLFSLLSVEDYKGCVTKSDFRNEKLVLKLLENKIIKTYRNPKYIYFDFTIKSEEKLISCLNRISIDVTDYLLTIWRCSYDNSKKGTKHKPNDKSIKEFAKLFDCLILDEIHQKCSSHDSLTFRILKKLSKDIKYRYSLTGTPFGKDPMKLWSQYYIIDRGETLGSTLGIFREAFFKSEPGIFGGTEYTFKKKLKRTLHKRLQNKAIRYKAEEFKDLLPVNRDIIKIRWPEENLQYYRRAIEGYKESLKGRKNFKTIENSFMKLRQISSGFLGFKNEDEEKLQIQFDNNPKLEMLEELILGIDEEEKIIIFNDFTLSGNLIEERLKKLKIKCVRLYGGTKDKIKVRNDFLKDETCRIFLAQNKSGGVSLNLQVAKYGIFYESPVACIDREQCETRYTGARQEHPCAFMYDLVMRDSVEERILEFHKEGEDITSVVLDGKLKL